MNERGIAKNAVERRTLGVELRIEGDAKIVGHAAIFNRVADIGFFRERIAPGAFTESLGGDVRALINHDPNLILGRTPKTLRLSEDSVGLAVEIDPPPEVSYADDLLKVMRRGDVTQMSFAFRTIADEWDRSDPDHPLRTLKKVELFDVSPVTFPAYEDTDVAVASRSWEVYCRSQRPPVRSRMLAACAKLVGA